ncbi:MFS transporter [Brucella abortus]|nr:MFS transporter [Brucella abortus]RYV40512.1 MFS transporter [Brucella abortus]
MAEATAIAASGSKRLAVTICVMMATLMQALDSTIANVALPYMQGSLATTSSQVNWVLTSYIVAAAILTPATGWLEERFGRRPLFIICVAGFVIASMLCGTATSIEQMVIYRMLQGAFGAPRCAACAGRSPRQLFCADARAGHGGFRPWRHAGPDPRPHSRWLADAIL